MPELDPIDEIKRRLSIVEVIGNYVPLKKAGRNFKGLCPFHAEKKPSFTVSPDKQVFHCFGCGAGGDLFSFIMKKEGIEFPEALQMLADKAGIRVKRQLGPISGVKKRLLEANLLAASFFHQKLVGKEGEKARDYLIKRGVRPTTAEVFRLGYAPAQGLFSALRGLNLTPSQLTDWGFAIERESGLVEKFRDRLIFPITDYLGRIVAFTGRSLDETHEPKYLNSPETAVFIKGQVLYGLNLAKEEIGKRGFAVAVEGQMDALSSYQSGVKNVVAISGTAFTTNQAELLARYAKKIILAFDNDGAGLEAIRRSLPLLSQAGFTIKVAKLSEKDPDSLIQRDPQLWKTALGEAKSAVEFFFEKAKEEFGFDTALAKQKVAEVVEETIAVLTDPVERELYINSMAQELGVGSLSLKEKVKQFLERASEPLSSPKIEQLAPSSPAAEHLLEEKLLALLITFPENLNLFLSELKEDDFSKDAFRNVYTYLATHYTGDREEVPPSSLILENLPQTERTHLAEKVLVVEEEYQTLDPEVIRSEIAFYIRLLKDQKVRGKRQELIERIAQAEQEGDQAALEELLRIFKEE